MTPPAPAATQISTFHSLTESERAFRAAIDATADGIHIVEYDTMRLIDVNESACRYLGYTREELLALAIEDFAPGAERGALKALYGELFAGVGTVQLAQIVHRHKDGTLIPIEINRRGVVVDGRRLVVNVVRDIRERLRAEQALRDSEARFRALANLSADWYWEQDEQFRLTLMSNDLAQKTGLDTRTYLGSARWDQPTLNLTEADWARHRAQLERHEPFRDFEMHRQAADGRSVWLSISGEPVFDDAGRFKGYRGVGRDITERKRAERLLALEHVVSRLLTQTENEARALKEVMREICESEKWECGRYFHVDEAAGLLRFREAWYSGDAMRQFVEASRGICLKPGEGLMGTVWQTGELLWIEDVSCDPRVWDQALARDAGAHGALIFPIAFEGRVIGVVAFSSRGMRAPDERLTQTIGLIGAHIGQFLKRKQAERVLRESEARFRSLTDLSSDFYWESDAWHRIGRTGGSTQHRAVANPAQVGKARWETASTYPDAAGWAAHRATMDAHRPFRDFEIARLDEDGIERYRSISGEPVFDESGAFKGYRGIGKDINARKREEHALRLEHAVTTCLAEAESAAAGVAAVIRTMCEAHGWVLGRYWRADDEAGVLRFGGTWVASSDEAVHSASASREVVFARGAGLVGRVWQTGEPLWVADTHEDPQMVRKELAREHGMRGAFAFPVVSEGKAIGVLGFASRTIREPDARSLQAASIIGAQVGQFLRRKQAEEVMRESEARFRSLTHLSSDFYWETDAEHRLRQTIYGSHHQPLFGRNPQSGHAHWDLPSTHPDAAGWAAHRATLEAHESFRDFEIARIDTQGVERHLSISGEPVLDESGAFKGYRGIGRDITERKRDQERQAVRARYQEKIARFGASALGKREAVDLVEDALQNVVEALPAAMVAYVEPGAAERELVMRGCAGVVVTEPATVVSYASADAIARVLEHGELAIVERTDSGAAILPFDWAGAFRCGALVPVHGEIRVQGVLCILSASEGAFGSEESKFLVTAASVLSAGLRRIDSETRLALLAQFDSLTGLPNRALLSDRFSQMIVQATRHGTSLGVLFIDLDDFKLVNDTLGHAGGDELLRETARRLQESVRPGDTVARISGDEFAVILGDLARPDDAALVAQKIIDRLSAPLQVHGHEVFGAASIGIAAFPADGHDAEALLSAADAAMYRAKESGRNSYQFFTPEINQRTRVRAQLAGELRGALEREEFSLVYQPKYDLRSGLPCAAEALLRWQRPDGTTVPPVEFIPVLEESGLIVQVGEWVLRRACQDLKAWQAAGVPQIPVAVNLSARQFRQQDLDLRIRRIVDEAGVDPRLVELEITESQLIHDPEHAERMMRSLGAMGIRVAIDDFGTGYSSLSYLTRFPVSALKIDRSFVADMLKDPADAAIVRAIIDMAHTLGFIVVAEGVETEAQAALLRSLGCEQAQGYFFARPMPEADLRTLISASIAHRGADTPALVAA